MAQVRLGRPKKPLALSKDEQEQLRSIAQSRALPNGIVRRARMVLLSSGGMRNTQIAAQMGTSIALVSFWRQRYRQHGVTGLHDELRPGRPRTNEDERIAALLNTL